MKHNIGCDQAFEQGWSPQICVDFVTQIFVAWWIAFLSDRFASGLGILTRVACTHSRVCFVERESSDGAVLEHGSDGCRGDVTESDMDFFHREWIGSLGEASKNAARVFETV